MADARAALPRLSELRGVRARSEASEDFHVEIRNVFQAGLEQRLLALEGSPRARERRRLRERRLLQQLALCREDALQVLRLGLFRVRPRALAQEVGRPELWNLRLNFNKFFRSPEKERSSGFFCSEVLLSGECPQKLVLRLNASSDQQLVSGRVTVDANVPRV